MKTLDDIISLWWRGKKRRFGIKNVLREKIRPESPLLPNDPNANVIPNEVRDLINLSISILQNVVISSTAREGSYIFNRI